MKAEGLRILCLIMPEWLQVRHNALAGDAEIVFKISLSGWRQRERDGGQASPRSTRW